MLVITLFNTKGGTAKSTLAANLGGALAQRHNVKVLLVDGDPQKTLSRAFPIANAAPGGYKQMVQFTPGRELDLAQIVSHTTIPGLHIVQANSDFDELKAEFEQSQEGYLRVRLVMDRIRESHPDDYDLVIIDSSGTPGVVSYACAVAADLVVSPIIPDRVTVEAFFGGAGKLLADLSSNPYAPYRNTPIIGVFSRMRPTVDAQSFRKMLVANLDAERTRGSLLERIRLANTEIPESASYPKASTARAPITDIDEKQAQIVLALAAEIAPSLVARSQAANEALRA